MARRLEQFFSAASVSYSATGSPSRAWPAAGPTLYTVGDLHDVFTWCEDDRARGVRWHSPCSSKARGRVWAIASRWRQSTEKASSTEKRRHGMWRSAKLLMASSMVVLVAAGSVWAQAQMPMPRPTPPIAPAQPLAPAAGSVEGMVKKVDLTEGTVRVATGWFGLIRRTLSVTSDTRVQVDGRQGTLMDVSEGAEVKASYEVRDGKNIATHIDVTPQAQPPAPATKAHPQAPTPKAPQQ